MLHAGLSRARIAGGNQSELLNELVGRHVIGGVTRAEEIAQAILFLADSERSSLTTGQLLVVDGGRQRG